MSSRCVHAANAALASYIKAGRNTEVIKVIPIDTIDRYDVWQCVFEKEPAAYKVLQEKELYQNLLEYRDKTDLASMVTTVCIVILTNLVEFGTPLKVEDGLKIISDVLGKDFLVLLKEDAEEHVKRRQEIVKPYFKHDNEWVGYSKSVLKAVKAEIKRLS